MEKLKGLKKSIYFISFPMSFIAFILPLYASNYGASTLEIGILYSIFSLCSILIRPIVGSWIDNRGRKSGIIVGQLLYTLVILLFFVGDNFKYIFVARVIQSIASSFLWISVDTMISDISEDNNRSKNFGEIDQNANKGGLIGSFIGFTILFNRLSDNPFKIAFSIFLITSIIALYIGINKTKETLVLKEKGSIEKDEKDTFDRKFIKFLFIIGGLSLVSSMLAPIYLVYMKDYITRDLPLISFLYIPGAVLSIYLPRKFGMLSDKYGRKNLLLSGLLIQAFFIGLIPIFKNYFIFMLIHTIISIGGMMSVPARSALIVELTGGNRRGRAYGLYYLSAGIGGILGPLFGAIVYDYIGHFILFYVQGATVLILTLLIALVLREKKISGIKIDI